MSLTKDILRITARYYPIGYRELYEYLYNETVYGKKLNRNSIHTILNRMKRQGLINKSGREWSVTKEGKDALDSEKKSDRLKIFEHEEAWKNQGKPKNLIIIFDIPEKRKRYREWLRMELVGFGFTLIQKSVWLGPALPKEFIEYLNEVGILKHIRFFRATEKDLI